MLTEKAPLERLTYSVEEVAKILGISRNHAFDSVKAGDIPSLKIGKRLLVPRVAIERMLDEAGKGRAA